MRRVSCGEFDRLLAQRTGITQTFAEMLRREFCLILAEELSRPSEVYLADLGGLLPKFRPRCWVGFGWAKAHYYVLLRPCPEMKQRLSRDTQTEGDSRK